MRKVLLLEANGNAGDDLLAAALAVGVDTLVATHEELYERYAPSTRERIAGTVFTDFAMPSDAVEDLVRYGRAEDVAGVVTGWEFLSSTVNQVAAELGLPGHDHLMGDACRNKRLMSQAFERAGVSVPRTVVVGEGADASTAIRDAGLEYPVVVKPAENAGSVGVSVVRSEADLAAAVRHARSWPREFPHDILLDPAILVQQYIGGAEYSVETVITHGRIHHLAVTQKFTTNDSSRAELGHTVPAAIGADTERAILQTVTAALNALGLRNGLGHTEVKVPEDGPPRIIEVGARPPGDHIMKLVKLALGIDEAEAYLRVALGEEPALHPTRRRAAAIRFITAPTAGVFSGLDGFPQERPDVSWAVYAEPGTRCGTARDNVGRLGHVIVVADTPQQANDLANEVLAGIAVTLA
jgi:biotin carboxylase